jgi:hypothetical protein
LAYELLITETLKVVLSGRTVLCLIGRHPARIGGRCEVSAKQHRANRIGFKADKTVRSIKCIRFSLAADRHRLFGERRFQTHLRDATGWPDGELYVFGDETVWAFRRDDQQDATGCTDAGETCLNAPN